MSDLQNALKIRDAVHKGPKPTHDGWQVEYATAGEVVEEAARLVADPPDAAKVRSYFVANMMDGDDGGVMTISMKTLADEATQIVGFILEDAGLITDAEAWVAAALTGDTE